MKPFDTIDTKMIIDSYGTPLRTLKTAIDYANDRLPINQPIPEIDLNSPATTYDTTPTGIQSRLGVGLDRNLKLDIGSNDSVERKMDFSTSLSPGLPITAPPYGGNCLDDDLFNFPISGKGSQFDFPSGSINSKPEVKVNPNLFPMSMRMQYDK